MSTVRLVHPETGVEVQVSEELALVLQGFDPVGAAAPGLGGLTVRELRSEIESRNEGRDPIDMVSLDGNKAALVAALQADDEKES